MALSTSCTDSFNRANGALGGSALDNANGGTESDTWTAYVGSNWVVTANQCANTDTIGDVIAVVDSTAAVDEQQVSALSNHFDCGVIARWVTGGAEGSYYLLYRTTGNISRLYRVIPGVTQLASDGPTINDNDRIGIYCVGDNISASINGAVVIGPTAGGGNATGKPGLYGGGTGSTLLEDFKYEVAAVVAGPPPATATDVFLHAGLGSPTDVALGADAIAPPSGVEAAGATGTATATGAANATPSGVEVASAVGTPVASGAATIAATGVAATGAAGTPVATGAAVTTPSGVQATGAAGTPVGSGSAVTSPAGVQATSAVGSVVASGDATAAPAGVQATGAVGDVIATGGGTSAPAPVVEPARIVGTTADLPGGDGVHLYRAYDPLDDDPFLPALRVDGTAYPLGVEARGAVGQVIASGSATTAPAGVEAVISIGRARPVGGKNLADDDLIALLLAA